MTLLVPEILRNKHSRHRLGDRAGKALKSAAMSEAVVDDTGITAEAALDRTQFDRPVKAWKSSLRGQTIDLGVLEPILSAKEVKDEYGADLGALTTVVELPVPSKDLLGKPKEVYVFTKPGMDGGQDQADMTHYVMGKRSLDAFHTAATTGRKIDESLTRDIVTLSQGGNEKVVIGRDGWLPDLGFDPDGEIQSNPALYEQFKAVSRAKVTLSLNSEGSLELADLNSHNGIDAYHGDRPWSVGQYAAPLIIENGS
jgi:hypothetical protein